MSDFRHLIHQSNALLRANLKARYRKTLAGFLWVILNPLIIYGVQVYVFKKILDIKINHYALFLLGGLLPWIFISQSIEMMTPLFVNSSLLLKSFKIHPLVLLSAQIADNSINFFFEFVIIFLICFFRKNVELSHFIFIPIPFFILFVSVFCASWILSVCNVFFRDTKFLVSFVLSILFFLTPIFYPIELVPKDFRRLTSFNPLYHIIKPFRMVVYDFEPSQFWSSCWVSLCIALFLVLVSFILWKKLKNEIYHRL